MAKTRNSKAAAVLEGRLALVKGQDLQAQIEAGKFGTVVKARARETWIAGPQLQGWIRTEKLLLVEPLRDDQGAPILVDGHQVPDRDQIDAIHAFEKAGLGKAPFQYLGSERKTYQACHGAPVQPGGACAYCGTGIVDCCNLISADGKRFHVGNVCVYKTGDAGMIFRVRKASREVERKQRHLREAARIEAGQQLLQERPDVRQALGREPHPDEHMAKKGWKAIDWIGWMFDHAGNAGKLRAIKVIRDAAKKLDDEKGAE